MSGAGLVDLLLSVSDGARQVGAAHPWSLPAYFAAAFAIGWFAPHAWDAARRHRARTATVLGVALGALVLAALVPAISTSAVAGPPCALSQGCTAGQRAHELCSQRHDDWQRWQRCVARRTNG